MRLRKSLLAGTVTIAGLLATVVDAPFASAAPYYNSQSQHIETADNKCDGIVAGGTYGSTGQFFADTNAGGGCSFASIEIIYVDNNGNEQASRQEMNLTVTGGTVYDFLPAGSYRSVLEVTGDVTSWVTGENASANLFF